MNSRYGKKSIGVPSFLSLSPPPPSLCCFHTFSFGVGKRRKRFVGAGSVKVEGWRGLDGERKFCKGGTDGGGGRAKGKTTAKRHSWMPLKTWPHWWSARKSLVGIECLVSNLNAIYLTWWKRDEDVNVV